MTLEKLLFLYNFRLYRDDFSNEQSKENSDIIRIYIDYKNWFEFGIYDWYENELKEENIKKILTKELLNKKVDFFSVDDDMNMFKIYLKEEW